MIRQARSGLRQLVEVAKPSNFKVLRSAGAVGDVRGPLGIAAILPWLVGRGASLGVAVQMHAVTLHNKPALHDRHGTLTYGELNARSNQVLHALHELRVGPKDRLGLLLRNGRVIVEATLAAQKGGIVACPLNTWAKPKELAATLANVEPSVLIYDTANAEQVRAAVTDEVQLVFVGDRDAAVPGSLAYDELIRGRSTGPVFPFTRDPGSTRVIIQTSGTTGTPKGAARDATVTGLGALARLLQIVPYHRDDVVLCPAPMFHSFGLATLSFALGLGSTLVLPDRFDPEETLAAIERHRCTAVSLVPVMIRRTVSLSDDIKSRYDLSSLRILLASGSAIPQDLREAATELFGDVLYDLYGSTEAGWIAIATPEDIKNRPRTVGKPTPGVELAIFSDDGTRLEPGETGEIYIRSDVMFEGYTSGDRRDEREGYMSVGDLGRLDTEGYLYVESRADDMVVIGGENVYPIEVENAITSLGGVSDAAVVGIDDEEYGKVLVAFVEGRVSTEDVTQACKAELASYKVPRRIEVMDELPRTGTGKILKRRLIERLAGTPADDD